MMSMSISQEPPSMMAQTMHTELPHMTNQTERSARLDVLG